MLLDSALPLSPRPRADLLYNSPALENAHAAAAVKGDTSAPSAESNVDLHYVCFVKSRVDGHLWELDGRRKGPLDRGPLEEDEDVLSEQALALGVRPFLKRGEETTSGGDGGDGGEMRFSLVVLSPTLE
jgi:ubiquitin carboxyl-terminal hydrolase L3